MESIKKGCIVIFVTLLSSCSTMSSRDKTLLSMGVGSVVGGVLGSITTPDDENTGAHVAMGAGIGAAVSGVAGLLLFDSEHEMKEREKQIEVLKAEVKTLNGETEPAAQSSSSKELFGKDLPPEMKKLIRPGEWQLYEVNNWVKNGDNTIIHEDKIFKMTPPVLTGVSKQ